MVNSQTFYAGIHAEIAVAKYEYWSSFAPLPLEVVLAAGQKAKDESSAGNFLLRCMCFNVVNLLLLFLYFIFPVTLNCIQITKQDRKFIGVV